MQPERMEVIDLEGCNYLFGRSFCNVEISVEMKDKAWWTDFQG